MINLFLLWGRCLNLAITSLETVFGFFLGLGKFAENLPDFLGGGDHRMGNKGNGSILALEPAKDFLGTQRLGADRWERGECYHLG